MKIKSFQKPLDKVFHRLFGKLCGNLPWKSGFYTVSTEFSTGLRFLGAKIRQSANSTKKFKKNIFSKKNGQKFRENYWLFFIKAYNKITTKKKRLPSKEPNGEQPFCGEIRWKSEATVIAVIKAQLYQSECPKLLNRKRFLDKRENRWGTEQLCLFLRAFARIFCFREVNRKNRVVFINVNYNLA